MVEAALSRPADRRADGGL